jgi:HD-GYP domain-containing protein (c-di-GMP phosphodiesterase class II)
MRLVSIEQLRPGDRLARDVRTGPSAIPLLRAGVRLGDHYVDGLRRAGVPSVYVDDDLSAGIEPIEPLREETRRSAAIALETAFSQVTPSTPAAVTQETVESLKSVAELIAAEIAASPDAAVAISDLAAADSYTLQHSLDTTAVGVLLAHRHFLRNGWIDWTGRRRFDRLESRLVLIGTGLLLHDIGKLAIPLEILHKPGPLSPQEWDVMREHPVVGHAMVEDSAALSPLVKSVIRSHHERWDGSGYPSGTRSLRIPLFARIAAVADVFDAVTSARPYKDAVPIHVGCALIDSGSGTLFDPEIVDTFRLTVAPYPVGSTVRLADGRCGVVSETPRGALDRPVIRVVLDPEGNRIDPVEVPVTADAIAEVDVSLDPIRRSGRRLEATGRFEPPPAVTRR